MRKRKIVTLALLVTLPLGLLAPPTAAAPLGITNPGFEDITGESPNNEFTFGPLNGWDLYDPVGIAGGGMGGTYFIGTLTPFEPDPIGNPGVFANFPAGAAEGQRVAIAFNRQNSVGQGEYGLVATLADTLQAHTSYTLQVEIGNIDSATSSGGTPFDLRGLPGYRVDLLAGGVVVAQDNNSLLGAIDDGEFATSTITLTTGSAHPQEGLALGIRLVNLNQLDPAFPDSDLEVDFDDVRLDATATTPGNFDGDEIVDGADFLIWQRGFPNFYSATDLSNWQTNFGTPAALTSSHPIPEPTTHALLLIAMVAAAVPIRPFKNRRISSKEC